MLKYYKHYKHYIYIYIYIYIIYDCITLLKRGGSAGGVGVNHVNNYNIPQVSAQGYDYSHELYNFHLTLLYFISPLLFIIRFLNSSLTKQSTLHYTLYTIHYTHYTIHHKHYTLEDVAVAVATTPLDKKKDGLN